jgi:hypothetical protein
LRRPSNKQHIRTYLIECGAVKSDVVRHMFDLVVLEATMLPGDVCLDGRYAQVGERGTAPLQRRQELPHTVEATLLVG